MQKMQRRFDPNLLATINMLGIASIFGFLYCLAVLLHGSYWFDMTSVTLYLLWFAICYLSVYAMKQGDVWGAYALAIATLAITIYDLVNGVATIGGAIVGTIVMVIVISYIFLVEHRDHTMDTRLTN